jgi:hypothetical protein
MFPTEYTDPERPADGPIPVWDMTGRNPDEQLLVLKKFLKTIVFRFLVILCLCMVFNRKLCI